MTVTVRPATPADVDAVVAVGHATWPAAYTAIAGEEYVRRGLAEWWSTEGMAQAIAAGRVLVSESDGQVTGVASYSVEGDVVDISKLYVVPDAQGTGAGARAFYERHGFRETHRTADELGGPDSVWMRLLPPT